MTEAQREVYGKIKQLLTEHFEGSLLVVVEDTADGRITTAGYTGGLAQAIGLARAAEHKMLQDHSACLERIDEDEQEED